MENKKHLEGEGEFSYDDEYDTLLFKIKNRDYKKSFEFQNFVVDIDKDGFVMGIRVFDASRVFSISKAVMRSTDDWEFRAAVENNIINITFRFVGRVRSKIPLITKKENFTQQITHKAPSHLMDSYVRATAVV